MDKTLFPLYLTQAILPCYPNVQPETVRDPVTKQNQKQPLIIKTDTGPGQLSKDTKHVKERKRLFGIILHILLGLINSTEATQELDQGFAVYKPASGTSTL